MVNILQYIISPHSSTIRIINCWNEQISINLKQSKVETRPTKSNGLWCCVLLPTILTIFSLFYDVAPLYKLITCLSMGLLFYSVLLTVFLSVSSVVIEEPFLGGSLAASTISALLIYSTMGRGLFFTLLVSAVPLMVYSSMLCFVLTKLPKTFSIGEAMVVTQSVTLFGVMATMNQIEEFKEMDNEILFINDIVYTVLSTVGLIVTALYTLQDHERKWKMLCYILTVGAIFGILLLHTTLGSSCILDILGYIFRNNTRVNLFVFWLCLLIVSASLIYARTKVSAKANTVTRKSFHILASLVFMSGIITDANLMTLAAGIGLGLLVFVEALRKSQVEPISSSLQSAFLVYSDEKDCGVLAMTPIYLYVGLSCPLVLVPRRASLELLSGVLAIGVGDTAASWLGSRYGVNKWHGSNRSIEGTVSNVLSQIAVVYALKAFGLIDVRYAIVRTALAATISALVEAKIEQVDNLILPLVTIIAFQLTSFLQ